MDDVREARCEAGFENGEKMQGDDRNGGSSRTTYLFLPSDHLNEHINQHLSELFKIFASTLGRRRGAARHLQWGAHHPEVPLTAEASHPPISILSSDFGHFILQI